ncbi:mitochondrial chaperone BCS1 [Coprinopsis sp. MPI-PUGE-AT-0042]|nr:mitochondrial chaperone BCS1 [Coprinopsis sp. MPI-PUGE-AT-0042]
MDGLPQGSSSSLATGFMGIMGISVFASLFQQTIAGFQNGGGGNYVFDTARIFVLGALIEGGRRFFQWLIERVRFQYSTTATFTEGDPAYEWVVLFLTEENIWKRSKDFHVNAKSSTRRWGINLDSSSNGLSQSKDGKTSERKRSSGKGDHVDFVPTYELPHLFRWKGYWIETKRSSSGLGPMMTPPPFGGFNPGAIVLTIYSIDVQVLQEFVHNARTRYLEHGRSSVILHSASQPNFGGGFVWSSVRRKLRRPLDSIILEKGVIESVLEDAREFIEMEDWYIEAGIPHRRGYLLHGPPGTGKTSTIHALAGELGLEIFSLSLSAGFVDDAFLQQAASSIPKKAIFLIEDIDCAFSTGPRDPSCTDADDESDAASLPAPGMTLGMSPMGYMGLPPFGRRCNVTLSGLLNVIDGIGSEEGVLFFATTNYVERLDGALLRPGRIDKKVEYKLTTKDQSKSLFARFFPASRTILRCELAPKSTSLPYPSSPSSPSHPPSGSLPDMMRPTGLSPEERLPHLQALAHQFALAIPENIFTTAELQGYLLSCKKSAEDAANGASNWVRQELATRSAKASLKDRAANLRRLQRAALAGHVRSMQGAQASTVPADAPLTVGGGGEAVSVEGIITPPSTPPLGSKETVVALTV